MRNYDSVSKKIIILNRKMRSGTSDLTGSSGNPRLYYKVNVYWSTIEEVLLKEMMENEKEYSRAALIRRCIHERAMRTLSEERYYEILENPGKFLK